MPDHIFDPPRQKKLVPCKGKKDFEFSQNMQDRIQDSRQKNLPPILNVKFVLMKLIFFCFDVDCLFWCRLLCENLADSLFIFLGHYSPRGHKYICNTYFIFLHIHFVLHFLPFRYYNFKKITPIFQICSSKRALHICMTNFNSIL